MAEVEIQHYVEAQDPRGIQPHIAAQRLSLYAAAKAGRSVRAIFGAAQPVGFFPSQAPVPFQACSAMPIVTKPSLASPFSSTSARPPDTWSCARLPISTEGSRPGRDGLAARVPTPRASST